MPSWSRRIAGQFKPSDNRGGAEVAPKPDATPITSPYDSEERPGEKKDGERTRRQLRKASCLEKQRGVAEISYSLRTRTRQRTAAGSTLSSQAPVVNEPDPSASINSLNSTAKDSGWVDFAFLRENVTMQQVLTHLNWLTCMRGSGPQRRGPCPIHGTSTDRTRTFSVHLQKSAFQCFHPPRASHGNVLDLWAAVHRLPLLEAAHHLAATFNLGIARGTEKRNP